MNTKTQLYELFNTVVSLLKDSKFTLVMTNQGSSRGQIYSIFKATHTQAETECFDTVLFNGTAKECIFYLQGMRDDNHYFKISESESGKTKMFLIKDHSGRDYQAIQSIDFCKKHFEDIDEEDQDNFYEWLDECEIGDEYQYDTATTFTRMSNYN